RAMRRAEECLRQGFTTVRDAGGADYGFRLALEEGHAPGPRLLVSGNYISQTGGHGDKRRRAERDAPVDCCIGMIGSIADGEAEEVRGRGAPDVGGARDRRGGRGGHAGGSGRAGERDGRSESELKRGDAARGRWGRGLT